MLGGEIIIKGMDLLRKWKKDNKVNDVNLATLEVMMTKADNENNLNWEKLKIQTEKSKADVEKINLENDKLAFEIKKMKESQLFTTINQVNSNVQSKPIWTMWPGTRNTCDLPKPQCQKWSQISKQPMMCL